MATLPTLDEKARMVLDIYQLFGTRPGEVLLPNNFMAVVAQRGWRSEDIADGLKHGVSKGWFEDGPNDSIRLTAAGFAAI